MWAYARPVEEINSDVVAADRVGTAAQDAASDVHVEQCPNFLSNSLQLMFFLHLSSIVF